MRPLSIIPAKICLNISSSPVRKCFVASSLARPSRNCSSVSTFLVFTIRSSWIVRSAMRMAMEINSSRDSGTGGRCPGDPKRSA